MSYKALCQALNDAIDKEARETNNLYVTDQRATYSVKETLDYDTLIATFNEMAGKLVTANAEYYSPRITFIIEKYLGKGSKIADSTLAQVELVDQIVAEIQDTLMTELQ